MALKFLILGILASNVNGFIPRGSLQNSFFTTKELANYKPYKHHLQSKQSLIQNMRIRLNSLTGEGEDLQLYLSIGQALYELVGSLIASEGAEGFVYRNLQGDVIVTDEFVWKITQDLDHHLDCLEIETSPQLKPLLKAALKEVSRQDIVSVIEELMHAPLD